MRQVVVALTIAVSAATVHGAWFASTDAREAAPVITISTWDYYEKSWTNATHDLATYTVDNPLTVRHSEDTIVAITGATLTLPVALNTTTLDAQALASMEIPLVPGAGQYLHLRVSKPANLAGSWPAVDPEAPWSGPIDPTDDDLGALDVDGSVGVHTVSVDGGGEFTWDIGRWSKGDIFLGINNHTYKVLDRNGNFKRFVASADYDQPEPDEAYNVTTGCATNWKTGEVFATNFGDYRPGVNIISRHPATDYAGDLSPYSSPSRRISTRIERTDDAAAAYANAYTSVNYGIDSSPESVAFDADMNMYVGHSFGNFRQAPAAWQGAEGRLFEFDDEWTEYTMAVDGLPLEGWTWSEGWGWVVDETGMRMLLAPAGTLDPDAFTPKRYGVDVSPRLSYNADRTLKMVTAGDFYPAVAGLPDWNPAGELPEAFISHPATGAALYRKTEAGAIVQSLVPTRWSMGKRLHRYAPQDGQYLGSEGVDGEAGARREAFWTFSGRQGTDWIDLDVTGEVMYYTSEDSFIHRYRVKPGPNGEPVGQLPDVGVGLTVDGAPTYGKLAVAQSSDLYFEQGGGLLGDYRFHGMRILPPGDGTGGFLVAVENGLGVHRFDKDGRWVQRYSAHVRSNSKAPDGTQYLVANFYTLEVDPGGRTFWASAHDTGMVFQFDIASGRVLKTIEAVKFRDQNALGSGDPGRRVEGICVMWEYTAPQEICFKPDGSWDGVDNDGDGYVDENCVAIEVCSAVAPDDDDGDDLSDQYDSDCSVEMPPVAVDDAYAINQQDPAQPILSVPATDGVLVRGAVDDYDRDGGAYADVAALKVARFGADESSLTLLPGATLTTANGGTVVLQANGAFVYTPDPAFHGVDSFAYQVTDGYPLTPDTREVPNDGENDLATVRITVAPKVANDGIFSLWVGETLSQGGLLANDPAQSTVPYPVTITEAGPSGTPVPFIGSRTFQTAQSNTVTVNADGSFSFTASNLAYGGPDQFIYAVHDTSARSWNIATVTFNVMRPVISVVVPDQSKTYDGSPLPTTCTVESSRGPGPHAYTMTYAGTIRGGASYGPSTTAPTQAGTYVATCTHTDPALGPQSDTGVITINPVPLTVTAGDTSRPYLAPNPAVSRTITGFVNSETESVLGGTTTCSTSVAQTANVGDYPDANTCTPTLSATNYTISYVPGDLRITGYVLTVTASNTEKFYGEPNPAVTYTITGFQGTDDASVINGTTTCSTTGGPNAGTYASANACTQTLSATNYSFVYVPGTLTIKKVPLVVTASTTSKVYGDPNPTVTRTIAGFVNGDDAGDLGGSSVCSTATSAGPNVGSYTGANTCTQNLTSPNYDISYVAGNFSITPRPLVAKANDKTIVLGSPLPTLDGTLTGGVVTGDVINVTYASTNAGTAAGVFPGVLIPTVTAGGSTLLTNYTITEIPGTLTVLAVAPCSGNDGYTTYSQGGWGSKPNGNNPGKLLATHFASVYPNGLTIGGAKTLTFTSAKSIEDYLPAGGGAAVLTASAVNPTQSAGVLSAQLLAVQLAVDFSAAGKLKTGLGALVFTSGPVAGQSLDQVLAMANAVLGGNTAALPSGMTLSGLAGVLESVVDNYHEGTVNGGLLACGGVTPPPPPPPPAPCVATTFTMNINENQGAGTLGNVRSFTAGGAAMKVLSFSRDKSTGGWAKAFTGAFSAYGLGVTDSSENGSGTSHTVDNYGRNNYIMFVFDRPMVVKTATLGYVSGDSDAQVWVGTIPTAYTTAPMLSDSLLNSLGSPETSLGGSSARTISFNSVGESGNVVVIAALTTESNDYFKVAKLESVCASTPPPSDDEDDEDPVPVCAFRTQTQGGWGSSPNGSNPGAFLESHFSSVFGTAGVTIGGNKKLTFTSAAAVRNFLPQGGTASKLSYSGTNVTNSSAGVFAGQVLALKLSVAFSNEGVTPEGLGDLKVKAGPLAGKTVAQVLAMAETALGGGTVAGVSISTLNSVVDAINNNFVDGTTNKGYLLTGDCTPVVEDDHNHTEGDDCRDDSHRKWSGRDRDNRNWGRRD